MKWTRIKTKKDPRQEGALADGEGGVTMNTDLQKRYLKS